MASIKVSILGIVAIMAGSGIDIKVRYYGEAYNIQKITSDITKEIYDRIKKEKDVEIAYPHTEIVMKDKWLYRKIK